MNRRIAIGFAIVLATLSTTSAAENLVSQRAVGWNQHVETDQHTLLCVKNLTAHPFTVEWAEGSTHSTKNHHTVVPGETQMHFYHQPAEPLVFRLKHHNDRVSVQVHNQTVYCGAKNYDCRPDRDEKGNPGITISHVSV